MLQKMIIHKSLYRPVLFVGCERLPFVVVTSIGGVVLMSFQSIMVACIVFAGYLILIGLIRNVNATDPQFFLCLYRYIRYYQSYYPANEFYPGKN